MVSLRTLIFEEIINNDNVTEANPVASVVQGFHTRKILKGMSQDERKELGRFLRDKEFIELSRQYHTSGDNKPYPIQQFIKQRVDDPKLAKKITSVALDPKFDQARNRLVTKMLVPRDTLPKSDEPLKITPQAQAQIDKDAKTADRKEKITDWLKTATVENPETGRKILVRSGLRASPDSAVYKAALAALNAHRKTLGMRASSARKSAPKNTPAPKSTSPERRDLPSSNPPRKITTPSYNPPSRLSSPSGGGFSFGGGGGFSGGGGGSSF
jgi:hypothetical protein